MRPVSSACRVGEQRAVVWKRLYFRPAAASFSAFGVWQGPPKALDGAEPGVVDQDDQHVGRALGRAQLLDWREFGVRILRVIGDQPGSLGSGDREMRTMFLVFAAHDPNILSLLARLLEEPRLLFNADDAASLKVSYSPPCLVPSFLTVVRLLRQYRRHTTKTAKRFRLRSNPAASDFMNVRIGMQVVSHQVGEPMQTKSYSPSLLHREPGSAPLLGEAARKHPEDVEESVWRGNCENRSA